MRRSMYLLLIFIVFSCKSRNDYNMEKNDTKLDKQKVFLYGKSLKSAIKIMNDSIDISGHFLFLYNGFDCETCIKNGYRLAKAIDSLSMKQVVYVISTSANIGADQLKYDYLGYVYNDEHDLMRSELKYIYTPVFLFFDSLKKIENVYYPNYNENIQDENIFVKNCLKKAMY